MQYCSRCVAASVAATPLTFDENGVCSGCRVHDQMKNINWDERLRMLRDLVEGYRSKNNYDILIPVSGGKDSYFQVHVATKVLGLKPLLVTYHGNNYLPEGTDHACKDIRAGLMTRDQGIEMVRKYDHVKPRRDLERWLRYVNMTENEFDRVCDSFRDPRVWSRDNNKWVKENIWDEAHQLAPA